MPDATTPKPAPEPTPADVLKAIQTLTNHVTAFERDVRAERAADRAQLARYGEQIKEIDARTKRHSGFTRATMSSLSETNDEFVDLKAGVIQAVAHVEENARAHRAEVDKKLDVLTKAVTTVAVDTKSQNVELAAQTATLSDQSTALARFRRTPALTTVCGAVGTGAGAFIFELIRAWLATRGH